MNDAIELPPLEGTPEQVAWAEQIRDEAAPVIAQWIATGSQYSIEPGMLRAGLQTTKASFWIKAKDCQTKADFLLQIKMWLRGTGPAPARRGIVYRKGAAARRGFY